MMFIKLSSILLALRMAISRSIKKNMAIAINIANGIISTPPFTNKENKDSLPAEEVLIAVLSNCNKILNMKCRVLMYDYPFYYYAKIVQLCNETKQIGNSCITKC